MVAAATQLRLERILAQAAAAERQGQGKAPQRQQEGHEVHTERGLPDHPHGEVRDGRVGSPGVVRWAQAGTPAVPY